MEQSPEFAQDRRVCVLPVLLQGDFKVLLSVCSRNLQLHLLELLEALCCIGCFTGLEDIASHRRNEMTTTTSGANSCLEDVRDP